MRTLIMLLLLWPASALAQSPRTEATARLGLGSLRVLGSEYTDTVSNVGAGLEFRLHPRLGLETAFERMVGLSPRPLPCALSVPCSGSAVEGTRSSAHLSGNVVFYFRTSTGIEPYIVGGAGLMRSVQAHAFAAAGPTEAQMVQQPDENDWGLSLGAGAGVRIPIRRFTLRPEIRLYDSKILSRANLSIIQAGVLVGVHW